MVDALGEPHKPTQSNGSFRRVQDQHWQDLRRPSGSSAGPN